MARGEPIILSLFYRSTVDPQQHKAKRASHAEATRALAKLAIFSARSGGAERSRGRVPIPLSEQSQATRLGLPHVCDRADRHRSLQHDADFRDAGRQPGEHRVSYGMDALRQSVQSMTGAPPAEPAGADKPPRKVAGSKKTAA